jgi:hypothetical protein
MVSVLMIKPASGLASCIAPACIVVVENLVDELKRLVPAKKSSRR